jgi:LPS O-antigen subunit length determinant protein (WzzB/FepE family)
MPSIDQSSEELHGSSNALIEIITVLWSSKISILLVTSVFFTSSVIYSLVATELWTSSALVKTVAAADIQSSGKRIGTMADMGSIALSASGYTRGDPTRRDIFMATMQSRDFLQHLITIEGVLPKLIATKSYNNETKEIEYNQEIYDPMNGWVNGLPPFHEIQRAYFGAVQPSTNGRTGLITIQVTHKSPIFAYDFLNIIIQEINARSRFKDSNEAEATLVYLNNELESTTKGDIKLAINQLIENQLKSKMLANVKQNHFIEPIDQPFIPEQRSSPRRTFIVMVSTVIGFLISFLGNLLYYFAFKKNKASF